MGTDVDSLWHAMSILAYHFSRLGGAARYRNMPESDIPLYVGCQLAGRTTPDFERSQYIYPAFLETANPVLGEVDAKIAEIQQPAEKLKTLLTDFVTYADQELKDNDCGATGIGL